MSSDDEGYVTRWKLVAERVKIPLGLRQVPGLRWFGRDKAL